VPLDTYATERVDILHRDKPLISVRGLNLEDMAILVREHLEDFQQLAEVAKLSQSEIFARVQNDVFILEVTSKFPVVTARLISLCADEPDSLDKIRTFPLGVQLKAVQQIVRLSLEDIGGPKAFAALVMGMIGRG